MRKKYDFKKYYTRKRKEGWIGLSMFGPRVMIEAVKQFVKKYKVEHDYYEDKNSVQK